DFEILTMYASLLLHWKIRNNMDAVFDLRTEEMRCWGRGLVYSTKPEMFPDHKRDWPPNNWIRPGYPEVEGANAEANHIANFHDNAWIYHSMANAGRQELQWVVDGKIKQTVTLATLRRTENGLATIKVIPVTNGALIWHLRKIDGRVDFALMYWKVNPEKDGERILYAIP
ncbi:MAG: hypothetical protein ACOCUY_00665, partial [Verrucomicrobiota bacterium]